METLPLLLAYLTDLDRGWLAVLRAQAWDADASMAVDAELPDGASVSKMSQTERTRLRSLLLGGTDAIEEWMEKRGIRDQIAIATKVSGFQFQGYQETADRGCTWGSIRPTISGGGRTSSSTLLIPGTI